jgi:transposase
MTTGFEVRFETPQGQQAQVDFAHFRTGFDDEPETERVVWLFSFVLGHSRMLWGRFVLHQDLQTLLRCHSAAFTALGGVPEQILYDRMRTVFSHEDPAAGHIVYNRTLVAFARHYGYLPKACQPYRAKTKAVRRLHEGLQSFLSMRRMDASRRKARALWLRFSQSLASRRHRPSQPMVRSTIHRMGSTTKPLAWSDRLTISITKSGMTLVVAFWKIGPV